LLDEGVAFGEPLDEVLVLNIVDERRFIGKLVVYY
jgi:hypothetical protein